MKKEEKIHWYYNQGFHGSVFWCNWGAETSSNGITLKDGWYKGIIPHFFREYVFEMLKKNSWLKIALELDGYTFEDAMKKAPHFIEELKKWISSGQLEIVDGTYSQPYAFIISGESNIRQLQYGKEATKRALGIDVKFLLKQEAYFHPQLPQILKEMGYKGVIMRTYWPHYGQAPAIDVHRVLWEGLDGTKIDTVPNYKITDKLPPWNPLPSSDTQEEIRQAGITHPFITTMPDLGRCVSHLRWIKNELKEILIPDITPLRDKEALAKMLEKQVDEELKRLEQAPNENSPSEEWLKRNVLGRGFDLVTIEEYFKLTPKPKRIFNPSNDEFDYRHLYGAFGDIMTKENKEAENKLYEAEVLTAISKILGGSDLSKSLEKAWKILLLAQTHDTFCIPVTYIWSVSKCSMRILIDSCDRAKSIAKNAADKALWHICKRINTKSSFLQARSSKVIPIVVFNQLSWERTGPVEVEILFAPEEAQSVVLFDEKREVPCQIIESNSYEDGSLFRAKIVFVAESVPSVGYKVYHLMCNNQESKRVETVSQTDLNVIADENVIENEQLRIKFNPYKGGCIESIYDKKADIEYLDTSSYYGNEFTGWFPDLGFKRSSESKVDVKVTEKGPVRATVKMSGKFAGYDYVSLIRLHKNLRRIDFETDFEFDPGTRIGDQTHYWPTDSVTATDGLWNPHDKLRVTFNPCIEKGQVFADMPFAVYPWNKDTILGYNWAEYTDAEKGLAVINTGNLGYYSDPTRNVKLSLILAYGGPARGKGPFYLSGTNKFKYTIYPHLGDWKKAKTNRCALEVNIPLIALPIETHKGDLERRKSFVKINPSNVNLSALICSGNSNEVILRLFENEGEGCAAMVKFNNPVKEAYEVNLQGQRLQNLEIVNGTVKGTLRPWGLLTMNVVF